MILLIAGVVFILAEIALLIYLRKAYNQVKKDQRRLEGKFFI
jgi:chromate transport protein ChrA